MTKRDAIKLKAGAVVFLKVDVTFDDTFMLEQDILKKGLYKVVKHWHIGEGVISRSGYVALETLDGTELGVAVSYKKIVFPTPATEVLFK